jgi:hypothetical protein
MRSAREIGVALALARPPLVAGAPPTTRLPRIGVIAAPPPSRQVGAPVEGLREPGRVEGRNITVEARSAAGAAERFPGPVRELPDASACAVLRSLSNPVSPTLAPEVEAAARARPGDGRIAVRLRRLASRTHDPALRGGERRPAPPDLAGRAA